MTSVTYSPDDRYIVTTSANGDVQTWSSSNGRLLRTQQDPNDPFLIGLQPAGTGVHVGSGQHAEGVERLQRM